MEAMLEGMAEKVLRGMTENAFKCKYNGGSVPMGYLIDSDKHYQIDPVTAPIIQEIITRYADGETIVEIAASLNARGIRSPWGKKFNTNSSIHNILKNEKYVGKVLLQKTVSVCGRQFINDGFAGKVLYSDNHPAIISDEMFDAVQAEKLSRIRQPVMEQDMGF